MGGFMTSPSGTPTPSPPASPPRSPPVPYLSTTSGYVMRSDETQSLPWPPIITLDTRSTATDPLNNPDRVPIQHWRATVRASGESYGTINFKESDLHINPNGYIAIIISDESALPEVARSMDPNRHVLFNHVTLSYKVTWPSWPAFYTFKLKMKLLLKVAADVRWVPGREMWVVHEDCEFHAWLMLARSYLSDATEDPGRCPNQFHLTFQAFDSFDQ